MKDYKNELDEFKTYAANTLKIHQEELNTRYENMKIDKDTVNEAYEAHRKIFEKELNDKASSLSSGNNEELRKISKNYIDQLSVNNTK